MEKGKILRQFNCRRDHLRLALPRLGGKESCRVFALIARAG